MAETGDEEPEDFSDDFDDEEAEDEDENDLFAVTPEPRTVCHLCGGAGFIADPKPAIIGGVPRTIDNGRECWHCNGARTFVGMVPPA